MLKLLHQLIVPFLVILFFFICLASYIKFFGPIPFSVSSVNTTKTDFFTVTGEGKASAIPNTAHVILGVTKDASSVQDAQNQVNTIANKITSDIKNLGVDLKDIQTTNYSVSPNIDFSSGSRNTNGYTVSEDLDIKIQPIDKANKAVDIATADGANIVNNVEYVLDDATQKQVENQARDEAINNAKEKAQHIAQTSGITLGRLINVQEDTGAIRPLPMMEAAGTAISKDATAPTQLNPGQNTVDISVTLSYETR